MAAYSPSPWPEQHFNPQSDHPARPPFLSGTGGDTVPERLTPTPLNSFQRKAGLDAWEDREVPYGLIDLPPSIGPDEATDSPAHRCGGAYAVWANQIQQNGKEIH
jgi:hypothetical protein